MTDVPSPLLLAARGIVKRFPGVVAVDDVGLEVHAGEILALVGENGAGKSTLIKILSGAYSPDAGELLLDGQPVSFHNIRDAKQRGIALIHQELMLAPNLDVAGNVFLGNEPHGLGMLTPLHRRSMNTRAAELLHRVGLNVSPVTRVGRLTTGQRQMVEIAKALALDARLLILDEPTSSLTLGESDQLFRIMDELRRAGLGLIFISHRMEEVLRMADRITVLRDGKLVGTLPRAEASHDRLVAMMVGRALTVRFPVRAAVISDQIVLEVRDLVVPGTSHGISFDVRRGEIFGFAGLVGSGRTELMQTIFGITPSDSGHMRLDGQPFAPHQPGSAIRAGVYLAPEDRKQHGLVLAMSVAQNISLPAVGGYKPAGFLQRGIETRIAAEQVSRLRIHCQSIRQKVVNLSGGNQQKVVLGKWLAMSPRVLIVDEPTRGIDVGAKAEIYHRLAELATDGVTILMVSSDMEEVIGLCDRVAVMHQRRLRGILSRSDATQERIVRLMTGATGNEVMN